MAGDLNGHPYQTALEKMRGLRSKKDDGVNFNSLTHEERWQFHADVYAYRRVVLGTPVTETTSPCDPDGKWFSEARISLVESYYRQRYKSAAQRRRDAEGETLRREGRHLLNAWAQEEGFPDIDDLVRQKFVGDVTAVGFDRAYGEAAAAYIKSERFARIVEAERHGKGILPSPEVTAQTAADLGVTAREYAPTPEQLAAGRRELGLDAPEAEAAA